MIGAQVELEILEIGASQVKLGIRAPREITVLRKEIQLTQDQNRAASQSLPLASLAGLRSVFQQLNAPPLSKPLDTKGRTAGTKTEPRRSF